jgi:hypothetical protein
MNYLYVVLHNDRPSATMARYAEIVVWEGDPTGGTANVVNVPVVGWPDETPRLSSHAVALGVAAGAVTTVGPIVWRPAQAGMRRLVLQVSGPRELGPLTATTPISLSGIDTIALNSNNIVIKDVNVVGNAFMTGPPLHRRVEPEPCTDFDANQLRLEETEHEFVLRLGQIDLGRFKSRSEGDASLAKARELNKFCRFESAERVTFSLLR